MELRLKSYKKKNINSAPVFGKNYLKTKIKSYNYKISEKGKDGKIPKERPKFICLLAIVKFQIF